MTGVQTCALPISQARGLPFLLSATEYAMPGCFMMLEQVVDEMAAGGGAILYSMMQLPERRECRRALLERALATGGILYTALEDLRLADQGDLRRWEDIALVREAMAQAGQPAIPIDVHAVNKV